MFKKKYTEVWGIESIVTQGGYYPAHQVVDILLQDISQHGYAIELRVKSFCIDRINIEMSGVISDIQSLKNLFCITYGEKFSLKKGEIYII